MVNVNPSAKVKVSILPANGHICRLIAKVVIALTLGVGQCHIALAEPTSKKSVAILKKPVTKAPNNKLPNISLTPDIMYNYLAAMMALQEGHYAFAFDKILRLAGQTQDPRLTDLALQLAIARPGDEKSLEIAEQISKSQPANVRAQQYYLSVALLKGRYDLAREVLQNMINRVPIKDRGIAVLALQQELSKTPLPAKDVADLLKLVADTYPVPESYLALALQYEHAENKEAALKALPPALKSKVTEADAILLLSRISPTETALKELDSYLVKHPKATQVRYRYIELLNNSKRYKDVQDQLSILLKYQPNNFGALIAVAANEVDKRNYEAAERIIDPLLKQINQQNKKTPQALAMHPELINTLTMAYRLKVQIELSRKNYRAVSHWIDLIEPLDSRSAQMARIDMALLQKHYQKAYQLTHQFVTNPKNAAQQTPLIIGVTSGFLAHSQYSLAEKLLTELDEKSLESEDVLLVRARIADKKGEVEKMESLLREMIRIYPKNPEGYNYLGYTLADHNERLEEAEKLINQAIGLAPDATHIMDSMGWLYYRQGKHDDALRWIKRAKNKAPNEPELIAHYVEILWAMGQKNEAKAILARKLKAEPDNQYLLAVKEKFQKGLISASPRKAEAPTTVIPLKTGNATELDEAINDELNNAIDALDAAP